MMSKQNVPELRFPEFDSEWEEIYLGSIGNFKNGINKDKNDFGFGVPFINLNNVFGKLSVSYGDYDLVNAHEKEKEVYNLKKGDTLFIRSSVKPSGVGLAAVVDNELSNTVYSGFLIRFRENEKYKINNNFKRYAFSAPLFRKQVLRKATSSANTNINQEELKRLILNLPSKEEQIKVGGFFSKIDRLIELEEKKLELLEEQKKGYMQKIFSQELRFKDENGNDYPDWESVELGEASLVTMGQSPKSSSYTENRNDTILVQGNADMKDGKVYPRVYTTSPTKFANIGDILISVRAPVGEVCILQYDVCIGRGVASVKGNTFIYFFLEYYNKNNKWKRISQGSTFESISGNDIRSLMIQLPSKEEQLKIESFLSNLDSLIKKTGIKVRTLQDQKKGLHQNMFV